MGWGNDGMHGSGIDAGLWLLMLGLVWVALVAVIVFLVIKLLRPTESTAAAPAVDSPEHLVDAMFARGEIDEDTYRSRRAALAEMNRP
jgi:putative membrane protein